MKEIEPRIIIKEYINQYVRDDEGNKLGVFLTMESLEKFLEELEDMFDLELAKASLQSNEGTTSHEELEKALTKEL